MAYYRLYSLDPLNSQIVDVVDFDADNDQLALSQIQSDLPGEPRELWNRGRKVKDIPPKARPAHQIVSSFSMLISRSQPWRWSSTEGNCQLVGHNCSSLPCAV